MPTLKSADVELYYELDGKERTDDNGLETVALLNGIAMSVRSWQPIRERLAARGYRCLLHDFRGQLRSGKPIDRPYSMELHAADFLNLLNVLDIPRIHLVGTSYGSEIGMQFAVRYPERVATLTVIAGASELDGLMRAAAESWSIAAACGALPLFRCLLPWTYSSAFLQQNRQLLCDQEQAFSRLGTDYLLAFRSLVLAFEQLDLTNEIEQVQCPVLIISAERDLLKGPRCGAQIHERIANSEFVIVPGAGHGVVFEQPETVVDRILDLLQQRLFTRPSGSSRA